MQKAEILDVKIKACRPRFKAGSDLSSKVNRIMVDIEQSVEGEIECVDVNLKWDASAELDCDREM